MVFGVIGGFCLSPLGLRSQTIGGTAHASPSAVQTVRVNHRRLDVAVPQEFLHRAKVVAVGQQVRGEGVPKRVAGDPLGQSGLSHCLRDGLLDERFVNVMASLVAGPRIYAPTLLRKHELPAPLPMGLGILAGQGVRQLHPAVAFG